MRLNDKVILVTGSTTGVGEAMARRFVAEGARVLVHGLEQDLGGRRWIAGTWALGRRCTSTTWPTRGPAARLVEAAIAAFGGIDAHREQRRLDRPQQHSTRPTPRCSTARWRSTSGPRCCWSKPPCRT